MRKVNNFILTSRRRRESKVNVVSQHFFQQVINFVNLDRWMDGWMDEVKTGIFKSIHRVVKKYPYKIVQEFLKCYQLPDKAF